MKSGTGRKYLEPDEYHEWVNSRQTESHPDETRAKPIREQTPSKKNLHINPDLTS